MIDYITFNEIASKKKTRVFTVTNIKNGYYLGVIKWYGAWRQYCFFMEDNTVFSKGCLQEIINFIEKLMQERKEEKANG